MLELAPYAAEKTEHVRASYDLTQPENQVWNTPWIAEDENGEWRSGKLVRIEDGVTTPFYYHNLDIPITLVPQDGAAVVVALDKDRKIVEGYFDTEILERPVAGFGYYPTKSIQLEKGMFYAFVNRNGQGRATVFQYTTPEGIKTQDPTPVNPDLLRKAESFKPYLALINSLVDYEKYPPLGRSLT